MEVPTSISLFSGYGGHDLAVRLSGVQARTVCYVEWDKYCQSILEARIRDGVLDDAPIWDDVREFDGLPWRGRVDIITASPPCQPYSSAGNRKGASDDRNLFPDTLRIISEVQPRRVYVENVPGLSTTPKDGRPAYAGTVVGELAALGYDCRWDIVSAKDAGAPHLRKRWWLVAERNAVEHAEHDGLIAAEKPGIFRLRGHV